MVKSKTLLSATAALGLLCATAASANEFNLDVNLGTPAPVMVAPAPVYLAPSPAYIVAPGVEAYDPHHRRHDWKYWHDHHDHDHWDHR